MKKQRLKVCCCLCIYLPVLKPLSDISYDNLLAEAFADDDIVDEFEEKKHRIEADENPVAEEDDITLMGWGSWTGPGTEEIQKKRKTK